MVLCKHQTEGLRKVKNIKKITAALLCAAALTVTAGCNIKTETASSKSASSAPSASSENTEVSEESSSDTSSEPESSVESSTQESSAAESSEEESSEEESSEEESVQENSQESSSPVSLVSMTESEAAEVSIDGYQFDDEQIVKDYHNAKEFTDNEEFNSIFSGNAIDTGYMTELRSAETISHMRSITVSYSDKWKQKVDEVYTALYDVLSDNQSERDKLELSQEQWNNGLSEVESSFADEAQNGGTEAFLSADAAMMNYYKGRAAILLLQIYEHNGSIDLSEYGL